MLVKVYRYTIQKEDFDQWKQISDSASKVYNEYKQGRGRGERLIRSAKDGFEIIELEYYESKEEAEKLSQKINTDPRIQKLFDEFLALVKEKDIKIEEFETV